VKIRPLAIIAALTLARVEAAAAQVAEAISRPVTIYSESAVAEAISRAVTINSEPAVAEAIS
jgi:hypothetical protein